MECAEFAEVVVGLMQDDDVAVFDNTTSLSYVELVVGLEPLFAVYGLASIEQDDNTLLVYKKDSKKAQAVLDLIRG